MITEAQHDSIREFCGWKRHGMKWENPRLGVWDADAPDYEKDLNNQHQAEEAVKAKGEEPWDEYCEAVAMTEGGIHASTAERAECLVEIIADINAAEKAAAEAKAKADAEAAAKAEADRLAAEQKAAELAAQ